MVGHSELRSVLGGPMSSLLKWKVYYADGSSCTNLDMESGAAVPSIGVIAIAVVSRSTGYHLSVGGDYYTWVDDCDWFSVDLAGLLIYLMQYQGNAFVLFGQMASEVLFTQRLREIKADPELPAKSAFRRKEVRL